MSKSSGNKKLAYAIVRVSTSNQKTDSQAADIVKVAEKMGYTIPKEYIFEEAVSGVDKDKDINYDRDSIKKLKQAIAIRKPDAIFCWELSRLTRTPNKVTNYIHELSLSPHIPLYIYKFGKGGIWTIDPENGEIQEQNTKAIRAAADAVYSELLQIRERTMRGRNDKAMLGKFIGHVADGYLVDGYGDFIVDEKRKYDIIKIFELYANHDYPTDAIASILNSEGIKTATHYRATSNDFPKYTSTYHRKTKDGGEVLIDRTTFRWTGELVSQCLNNKWYRGNRYYTVRSDENMYEEDRKKIEPERFEVPVFIDKELLDKVDEKLQNNRIIPSSTASKHVYLLSTLLFCGKCNRPMYGHHTGLYNHYYCSSAETKDKCGNSGVNQENIEAIIIERIKHKAVEDLFDENKKENSELIDFYNNEAVIREYEDKLRIAEISKQRSLDIISEQEKIIDNAISLQVKASTAYTMQAYSDSIKKAESAIHREEEKIPHWEETIHRYKRLIKQTKDIKHTIKGIEKSKSVTEYISLVKSVIQRIEVYSPERNTHIIIVTFVNNKQETLLYNPNLIRNGYIVLPFTKRHDIDEESIKASQQYYDEEHGIEPDPDEITKLKEGSLYYDASIQKIIIKGKLYFIHGGLMFDDGDGLEEGYQKIIDYCAKNNVDEETKKRLIRQETPQSKVYLNEIEVKELIRCYKKYAKTLICYYQREEPSDEKSIMQKEHYKELQKKKNTGLPTSLPRLERDSNTEQIQIKCKRIYNKIYKIKTKKNLTDEEKEQRIGELKDTLAKYRAMKHYIKREEQVRRFQENTQPSKT